jgi:hypothetical protein
MEQYEAYIVIYGIESKYFDPEQFLKSKVDAYDNIDEAFLNILTFTKQYNEIVSKINPATQILLKTLDEVKTELGKENSILVGLIHEEKVNIWIKKILVK